jgi:hypothetical protein
MRNVDIARELGLTPSTIGHYLHLQKAAGEWTPPEHRKPHVFRALLPAGCDRRGKRFGVDLSVDVVAELADHAKRRNRPMTPMLAAIITAAVDRGLVADLLDND